MMHIRGCYCNECNPGTPAQPTRVHSTVPRSKTKRERNAQDYLRRKLRSFGFES